MCYPIFLVSKCIFVVFKCWDLSHALLIDNSVLSFFELNYVPREWTVGDINKSCVTSSLASWYNVQIMINMVFNLAHTVILHSLQDILLYVLTWFKLLMVVMEVQLEVNI